jgi:hypothetical protein
VGLDITGMGASGEASVSGGTARRSVQVLNYDAVATWFPRQRGLFFRVGAGLASFRMTSSDPAGTLKSSRGGFGLLMGGGYSIWLGQSFNLAVNVDLASQFFADDPGLVRSSSTWNVWLGFDWS